MLDDVSADDYFGDLVDAPESNGDVTSPVGDIDSEVAGETIPGDLDETEGDVPDEAEEGVEDNDAPDGIEGDPEDSAEEWLPGFEGRFKVGEEHKALASYQELEKFHSRQTNELKEQIEKERKAAFEQAAQLLQQQQTQPSPFEMAQQRQALTAMAVDDPYTAFEVAVQMGDEGAVQSVLRTIDTGIPTQGIEGNPALAAEMRGHFLQMQQQQMMQQQAAQLQHTQAQLAIQTGYQSFEQAHPEAKSIPGLEDEMKVIAGERIHTANLTDQYQVKAFLDDCYERAIGRVALKYRQQSGTAPVTETVGEGATPQAPVSTKRAEKLRGRAETGTAQRGRVEQPTPADEYADDLLRLSKSVRP